MHTFEKEMLPPQKLSQEFGQLSCTLLEIGQNSSQYIIKSNYLADTSDVSWYHVCLSESVSDAGKQT